MNHKENPAAVVPACGAGSDRVLGQGKIRPKDSAASCFQQRPSRILPHLLHEHGSAPPNAPNWEMAMAERELLPERREHEVLEFEHVGLRCRAGVGRYADRRVGEIFLNIAKDGSTADVNARDSAIAASLALQHGCNLQVLRRALTGNPDGSAARPLGRLIDLLAAKDGAKDERL
jgi:hypothetical protein